MKKIVLAIAILTGGILISCNSGGSDPKSVLISFMDALAKKDVAAARKLATTDSKEMLDMMDMGLKMGGDKGKVDSEYDKANMEFGEAKIEGDKATVPVKDKKKGETTNYTLKKESGKWKVAFSKASMMEMGADKMKSAGDEVTDSISNELDNLKDATVDSLASELKDGLNKVEEGKEKVEEAGKQLKEEAEKMSK